MKKVEVSVPWSKGLHLRPAAHLVRTASCFSSQILLRLGTRMADARSVLNILLLSATLGSTLHIEISGSDEHEAERAIQDVFRDLDVQP
jgi:phosphocarrier protein HPr